MPINGRLEKELKADEKMQIMLSNLPKVFSDFYYYMSNKSYLTRYNYIEHVSDFMRFVTNGKNDELFYKNVTPIDISKYMSSIKTYKVHDNIKKKSDSAMAARWSSLNAFYNFLYVNNLVSENVVTKTERPRIKDEKNKPALTTREIRKMSMQIDENPYHKNVNRDKLIFSLGITTGLRVSAISQLNIEDVDLDNKRLQVIEKGDKYRVIEFGDNLKELFENYLNDREKYFGHLDTNAMFISQKRQRITNAAIRNLLAKYADKVTDKHVSAHTLRRTSASQLYNKTGDIYLVGNHLGHADISTTRRYISVDEEKQKNKVAFMDSII